MWKGYTNGKRLLIVASKMCLYYSMPMAEDNVFTVQITEAKESQ